MAEFKRDDSSDGILVIDEPNNDSETIEIRDDSDSDLEIVELCNEAEETSSTVNSSSSSTKFGITCGLCYATFSTNNRFLDHMKMFKGGCSNETNINSKLTVKRKKSENLKSKNVYKKNRYRSPKIYPKLPPVPKAIPIELPPKEPITFNPVPHTNSKYRNINSVNNNLPFLSKKYPEETNPVHQCTHCDQIFRYYIGLHCHLNSEHTNVSPNKVINAVKSPTKLGRKKQIPKKNVIKENKQYEKCIIENDEPMSNTVDLTLYSDTNKDTVLNRMKSYVDSSSKDVVNCVLCHKTFSNTKIALAHVENKHIMNKIECAYCSKKYAYEFKLRSHMSKKHKIIGIYKCDKCLKLINYEECESHLAKCNGRPIEIKSEEVTIINEIND